MTNDEIKEIKISKRVLSRLSNLFAGNYAKWLGLFTVGQCFDCSGTMLGSLLTNLRSLFSELCVISKHSWDFSLTSEHEQLKNEITQTLIYIARTDPPVHNRCLVPKGYIPSAFLLSTDGSKEFYSFTLHLQSVNPTTGDVTSNLMFASSNTSHHVVPANEMLGKCAFK